MKESKNANPGVHAQTGFALQRNTALYILLSNYHSKFEHNDYFICLEHHDDFLFCFLDKDGNCKTIDAYQSKKNSSDWTIDKELGSIISKLLETGIQLITDDSIDKTNNYSHSLYFSSNRSIKLEHKTKKASNTSIKIDETNCLVPYKKLPNEIQDKINNKLTAELNRAYKSELDKLHFLFVDLAKTDKEQQTQLIGKISNLFGSEVSDPKAAKEAIIQLFREIETVFNQGNKVRLLDKTKQVTSKEINEAFKLITTNSKAFDYWRSQEREIRETLKIPYPDRDTFTYTFKTAFDLFKSIENQEHIKILNFVQSNYSQSAKVHPEEVILELSELFNVNNHTNFDKIQLMAIIYAAYFQAVGKRD